MIAISLIVSSLLLITEAKPLQRSYVVLDSRESIPPAFVQTGIPLASTTLELRIALTHNDIAGLEQELYAVSTPNSDRYGQHLSKEQVSFISLDVLSIFSSSPGRGIRKTHLGYHEPSQRMAW